MIFATAANVIPFLVSTAPAAPKGLAHTAIIHPGFMGRPRALWADGLKAALRSAEQIEEIAHANCDVLIGVGGK
jgi:hypothetical protein